MLRLQSGRGCESPEILSESYCYSYVHVVPWGCKEEGIDIQAHKGKPEIAERATRQISQNSFLDWVKIVFTAKNGVFENRKC